MKPSFSVHPGPPKNDDCCRLLAEKITNLLTKGIVADENVDTYLASTFSNPSIGKVKKVVSDRSHAERDSLVDLLLFPDEAFQIELEPYLADRRFTRSDEQGVILHLGNSDTYIVVHMPALRGHIRLIPTPSELNRMIVRLNITWRMPQPLRRALEKHITEPNRTLVGVRLRNADLTIDESGVQFLCDFLNIFNDTKKDFLDYFNYIVDFLSQKPGAPFFTALMAGKKRLIGGLRQAVKFETSLRQANMETLMLAGVRAPAESATYFRNKIILIDEIAMALFDRTCTARGL